MLSWTKNHFCDKVCCIPVKPDPAIGENHSVDGARTISPHAFDETVRLHSH
jgi:hypothetical protein